jgi:hypothetical protein
MAAFPVPGPDVARADQLVLHAAVSAYLGRYRGQTWVHSEADLRVFVRWCTEQDLDPLAAVRVDIERYVRWLQDVRRYQASTGVERHDQRRRVVHEVEQVIEPAADRLPPNGEAWPASPIPSTTARQALAQKHRHSATRLPALQHPSLLETAAALPKCAGFPRLGVLRRLRLPPDRSAVDAPSPTHPLDADGQGKIRNGSRVH